MNSDTVAFVDGMGRNEVARRRRNPDGAMGGLVASTAKVHPGAIVDADAIVEPGQIVDAGEHVHGVSAIEIDSAEFSDAVTKAT